MVALGARLDTGAVIGGARDRDLQAGPLDSIGRRERAELRPLKARVRLPKMWASE